MGKNVPAVLSMVRRSVTKSLKCQCGNFGTVRYRGSDRKIMLEHARLANHIQGLRIPDR